MLEDHDPLLFRFLGTASDSEIVPWQLTPKAVETAAQLSALGLIGLAPSMLHAKLESGQLVQEVRSQTHSRVDHWLG